MKITIDFSSLTTLALGIGKVRTNEAGGTEAHEAQLDKYADQLKALIEPVAPQLEAIGRNGTLSDLGKRHATKEQLVRAWNQIEAITDPLFRALDEIIDRNEGKIQVKPFDSGNAVLDEMRAREIRDLLRKGGKEASAIRAVYLDLCESGDDPLFIHAIESAPASFPILAQADIEKGLAMRAKSEHPSEVREVAILKALRNAYEYLLYHAKSILKDLGISEVAHDWGKIVLNPITGAIGIGTLRPYRNVEIERKNVTTPLKAKAAGLDSDFLNPGYAA